MTRLAFGGKCGSPTSPPVFGSVALSAPKPSALSSVARAGMPMAIPAVLRRKNWRRVMAAPISGVNLSPILPRLPLLLRHRLIQIQNHARYGRPGREFARSQVSIRLRFANRQQFGCVRPVLGVGRTEFLERVK